MITWKEFKNTVESFGITDSDVVEFSKENIDIRNIEDIDVIIFDTAIHNFGFIRSKRSDPVIDWNTLEYGTSK